MKAYVIKSIKAKLSATHLYVECMSMLKAHPKRHVKEKLFQTHFY